MVASILSASIEGINAVPIHVEIDIHLQSLPSWTTVGLAESSVKESKDRVIAAIKNSGYEFLYRRVTINLAPADTRKEGTAFDLPIALGLLAASDLIPPADLASTLFVGELGLAGELRPVRGILPVALLARERGVKRLVVARANAHEAAVVQGISVYGFSTLAETVEFLSGRLSAEPCAFVENQSGELRRAHTDYADIRGQLPAKRAMEVAASGGHNILLSGPPGSGKTMLASRIGGILPPLSEDESLETSKIYSIAGLLPAGSGLMSQRPFREPHHSVSNSGLIGGGSYPRPGEVSLAHNGVLFLDELPEFQRHVLEQLRQPLEAHRITIARAARSLTYPAHFLLVCSCNPCPCGFRGHPKVPCRCTERQVRDYQSRLSGPLLDRIDLQVVVPPVNFDEFHNKDPHVESSEKIRVRVLKVRELQARRFAGSGILTNAEMNSAHLEVFCRIDDMGRKILKSATERYHLSARAITRLLKVARTLADMSESDFLQTDHLLEAIQYRSLDLAVG